MKKNTLHFLHSSSNLSLADVTELQIFMKKEKKLSEFVDLSKIKTRSNDNRCYIYINRKQYIGADYTDLICKLYDHYFGSQTVTLEQLYPQWQLWRRDSTKTSDKTIKENAYLYNAFYKDTDIVQIPLTDLKTIDFIRFFRIMTKDGTITRRRFNDAKSILNNIFYYAIEQELVERNPLNDINYSQFSYKPENDSDDIYTLEERAQILTFLSDDNDLLSLAIQLDFCLIARIGEIKALKWSDVDYKNKTIRLQRQFLSSQKVNDDLTYEETEHYCVDYIKGKTAHGFRDLPLIPKALEILNRIKEVSPGSEFLFAQTGAQPITTVTFNRHLKHICKELSIPYRPSHNIRFCVASVLYKHGVTAPALQGLLGHSTLAMTLHYLRNVTSHEELYSQITKVLS